MKHSDLISEIFYWIGIITVFLFFLWTTITVLGIILTSIINQLGRWFHNWWIIVDWAWHRKEFKQWLKDNVHPSNKKTK